MPQASLPEDFPPRSTSKPILTRASVIPHAFNSQENEERHELDHEVQVRESYQNPQHTSMPRLEIPMFEGIESRWWIRRCERFFQYYNITECQKISLAANYLKDMADAWYQGWIKLRNEANWTEFVEDFYYRFGEKNMINVIEEFNNLKQEGSVVEY